MLDNFDLVHCKRLYTNELIRYYVNFEGRRGACALHDVGGVEVPPLLHLLLASIHADPCSARPVTD